MKYIVFPSENLNAIPPRAPRRTAPDPTQERRRYSGHHETGSLRNSFPVCYDLTVTGRRRDSAGTGLSLSCLRR